MIPLEMSWCPTSDNNWYIQLYPSEQNLSVVILIFRGRGINIFCLCATHLQVKEFDSISRLDQWHTTLLLRIKKTIQGDEGDLKWTKPRSGDAAHLEGQIHHACFHTHTHTPKHRGTHRHTPSLTSLCIASGDDCLLMISSIPLLTAILSERCLCFPCKPLWI